MQRDKEEWVRLNICRFCIGSHLHTCTGYKCEPAIKKAEEHYDKMQILPKRRSGMKKEYLKAVFKSAKAAGARYIAVRIETEGGGRPEIIINQTEDFEEKLRYYMNVYDDELVLISALGKTGIRITAVAQGNSFDDIEWQIVTEKGFGWKQAIADIIERVYMKMLSETPPKTEEERLNCDAMKEAIKGMFINATRTATEARFIFEHLEKYEEIIQICMNGDDIQFKKSLVELQRLQNEYILREEKEQGDE